VQGPDQTAAGLVNEAEHADVCLHRYAVAERAIDNAVIGFAADAVDPTTCAG